MAISMKRLGVHLLAVGASLAVTGGARAVIVYSGVVNINIPSTVDGVYLNVVSGAFSTNARVSRIAGWSSDLLGASSYLWRVKHNKLHKQLSHNNKD